jgi:acyl dehydratase
MRHVVPGPDGRLMVQGLLTATLPTKIGGDVSFVAREMSFEFLRPVFTGDAILAELTVRETHREGERSWATFDVVCRNQDGKEVLRGGVRGFVLDREGG